MKALLSLSALLMLAAPYAHATGSFFCETQTKGDQTPYFLSATVSWSFGNAIVGKSAKFGPNASMPAPIDVAQYKNDRRGLYLLSVMDSDHSADGSVLQRVIEVKTHSVGDENETEGTLTLSHAGSTATYPVKCSRE